MENNQNFSPEKIQLLLNIAGKKLGTDPTVLKEKLENGSLEGLNLSSSQNQQLNKVLSNPKMMEQMLNNPKIQEILKNVLK